MQDPVTGNTVVFNGAIFNFRDLKRQMAGRVERYRSDTDTEALLYSYGVYGRACLDQWRGMFAVAIWDTQRRELFLVRDRLGIKPLYWYKSPAGLFAFASEVRALLASGLVPRESDPRGVCSYLAYGAVQAPWTMIQGVRSLLPGHYLVVRDGTVAEEGRYWEPAVAKHSVAKSREQVIAETRERLIDAVDACLIADAPLGAFLSGGIDSSALVALMGRARPKSVRTLSVVFEEGGFSEAEYSRLVAKKWGTDHREVVLTAGDVLAMLPKALEAMDQPTIDGVNTYVVARAAKASGLTVALSGLGGDEVFGGYSTFRRLPILRGIAHAASRLPSGLRRAAADVAEAVPWRGATGDKVRELIDRAQDTTDAFLIARTLFAAEARVRLRAVCGGGEEQSGLDHKVLTELRRRVDGLDTFAQVSMLELATYTTNMLLRDTDVMSMAHSLEIRVPFLDHLLVEHVMSLPSEVKRGTSPPKALLAAAMGDDVPRPIVGRTKMGFTLPWEQWLRGALCDELESVLADLAGDPSAPIAPVAGASLWEAFKAGRAGVTWSRVWSLYVLRKWWQRTGLQ